MCGGRKTFIGEGRQRHNNVRGPKEWGIIKKKGRGKERRRNTLREEDGDIFLFLQGVFREDPEKRVPSVR